MDRHSRKISAMLAASAPKASDLSRHAADAARKTLERDLLRGSLDVLILAALADGRRHAYRIKKTLAATGGQAVAPGTLHPKLRQLEAAGWITSEWDCEGARPRRWYALTTAGREHLLNLAVQWQACLARMQGLVLPAVRSSARRAPRTGSPPAQASQP